MGVCPITLTKFVGTFSLGLLTGTSYTLSQIALPTLALLPSASTASRTLTALQVTTTRTTLTLATISSLSLITAFSLASRRNKHPYLLWTALVSFLGGQGVEWWFNGFERFPSFRSRRTVKSAAPEESVNRGRKAMGDSEYVSINRETSSGSEQEDTPVNGEKVEREMARERQIQLVRTVVSGMGFMMGVIGIWGDGA